MDVLSFVLALAPILWLVAVLLILKWPAWRAAAGSLVIACLLAATWWGLPVDNVATAALEGFLMALWPIVVVIIAAVFTYNLCVRTGAMDTISRMITSISSDRRILALLVAWCFGGFMEGMAGFGTAVAIPAGMLAALGYAPLPAVLMCLLANGVPTPYGSIGIPTVSLADLVGLDASSLAFTQMIQLAPFFIVAPFLIVAVAGKGAEPDADTPSLAARFRGVSLVALAAGVSFTVPALLVAAFVGPELTVVVGSICSLGVTAALARRAEKSGALDAAYRMQLAAPKDGAASGEARGETALTLSAALRAWSCFILIFVLLLSTSKLVAPVNAALAPLSSTVTVYNGADPGTLSFSWVNTPGVLIFIAALVGGRIQGVTLRVMAEVLVATVRQMMPTVATMLSVLGCAKVMGYAGMISDISTFCIAVAGGLYPVLAPWIGMVGTFVTGSGTSSGMLFGQVQAEAAAALGMNEAWTVALNSLGVAGAVLPFALGFLVVMSAIAMAGAYLMP